MMKFRHFITGVLLFLIFISTYTALKAQRTPPTEDVIYLKNGSIVRGKLIQLDTLSHVRIEILGGSELVYPYSDVKEVKTEPAKYLRIKLILPREHVPVTPRERGIYHLIGWGMGFGQTGWENTITPMLHYSGGYYLGQFLQVGAGVNLDYYGSAGFAPVFAEWRADLNKRPIMPHVFVQLGYGFPTSESWQLRDLEGGWMGHAGVGMRINTRRRSEWIFTLGFKAQNSVQERSEGWDPWARREIISRGVRRYQRIVFMTQIGF